MFGQALLRILLFVRFAICVGAEPSAEQVSSYFRAANINSIVLLLCTSQYEQILTGKALSADGFQISYSLEGASSSSSRFGALLDTSCNDLTRLEGWFRDSWIEWLVFGDSVSELPALPDSSASLISPEGGTYDLFRAASGQPLIRTVYTPGQTRRHYDFRRIQLPAAQLLASAEENEEDPDDIYGGLECLNSPAGGWVFNLSHVLAENLADQLNFRINMIGTKRTGCRGLLNLMNKKIAVFSTTAIMMNKRKMMSVEYSTQLFRVKAAILYKQPGLSTVTNLYLLPFQKRVWLCCLAVVLIVTVLLVMTLKAGGAFEEHFIGADEIYTLVIGFICDQGTHLTPKSLAVRTIIVVFSTSALFLNTSYSANIVALLQSDRPTVRTLQELASSPLKLLLQNTTYNRAFFQFFTILGVSAPAEGNLTVLGNNDRKDIQMLVKEKKINDLSYKILNDGVEELRKGTTAIIVECSAAYRRMAGVLQESEKCGLGELEVYKLPPLAIPLVRGSGYREHFTRMLSLQLEVGLVSRSLRKHTTQKPACTASDSGFVSVGLTDFWPALMVLLYGAAASLAAFLLELVTASIQKSKPVQFRDFTLY